MRDLFLVHIYAFNIYVIFRVIYFNNLLRFDHVKKH